MVIILGCKYSSTWVTRALNLLVEPQAMKVASDERVAEYKPIVLGVLSQLLFFVWVLGVLCLKTFLFWVPIFMIASYT